MRSAPLEAFLELVRAEKLMKGSVSRTDDVPGAFVLNGEGCGYFFCRVVVSDLALVSAWRALCASFWDARPAFWRGQHVLRWFYDTVC